MFEQACRNIDDVLRKEAGWTTELDYTEQIPWLLFLKYLYGLEEDKATDAVVDLGAADEIGKVFSGFQKYLYQPNALSLSESGRK